MMSTDDDEQEAFALIHSIPSSLSLVISPSVYTFALIVCRHERDDEESRTNISCYLELELQVRQQEDEGIEAASLTHDKRKPNQ